MSRQPSNPDLAVSVTAARREAAAQRGRERQARRPPTSVVVMGAGRKHGPGRGKDGVSRSFPPAPPAPAPVRLADLSDDEMAVVRELREITAISRAWAARKARR